MDNITNVYEVEDTADSEEPVIPAESVVIEETMAIDPTVDMSDREILVAIYAQQAQIGGQLNWLCENLAGVFGMVTAMSQNGGGVRGLMKVMKEMKTDG